MSEKCSTRKSPFEKKKIANIKNTIPTRNTSCLVGEAVRSSRGSFNCR